MSTPLSLAACIDALGGTTAVARACGVSIQAVSNWKAAGAVPARHAIRLWAMAKRGAVPWWPDGTQGLDLVVLDEDHAAHPEASAMFPQCSCHPPAPAGVDARQEAPVRA